MANPEIQPLILGLVLILGLCVGSFLNVVGLRFLADESIVSPPSACPHCKHKLAALDNIPVISWLLLGGRCRYCQAAVSIQYPLIELATGILFVLTVWKFGISWQSLFLLFFIANLVVIFITDIRESVIFTINSLSLVPVGLAYSLFNLGQQPAHLTWNLGALIIHPDALISAVIAMVGAIVFFEGMILLSRWFFGTDGFGHGDTHLMMGVGAFLGWPLTLLALLLGFFAQTIPAIPMLIYQWIQNKQWVSLISGGLATVFGLAPMVLLNSGLATPVLPSFICLLLSLVCLIVFLKQVRQSQSFTYLPLGPALVIGTLAALFWGPQIVSGYMGLIRH